MWMWFLSGGVGKISKTLSTASNLSVNFEKSRSLIRSTRMLLGLPAMRLNFLG